MQDVIVQDVMTKFIFTTTLESTLLGVVHKMRENAYSCMVVIDKGEPVGIVTERDLVKILADVLERRITEDIVYVKDFMSTPPIVINQTASLFDALVLTQARKIRHLPVVDNDGHLKGILTYSDIAHAHSHIIEQQSEVIANAVAEETRELKEANGQLKAMSMEDALLEIGNRRAMEVDLTYTHNGAKRYGRPYSVVLFDVDCFKLYNDHYGHAAGDKALKAVSDHISASIRKADRLYRYGGEELLLILPETELLGAEVLSGRIVEELQGLNLPHEKSDHKVLTMSGGIGYFNLVEHKNEDWNTVVELADQGLYKAKEEGRNKIAYCT